MSRIRNARRRGDPGFTFVEVLVVIIILAILSLIAIATFLGQRDKAERSRAVSSLRNAETFAVAVRSDREDFSECIDDYEREAGQNAPYQWVGDDDAAFTGAGGTSTDANQISVFGPETSDPCDPQDDAGGWVSFAALARDACFYNLLVPGSNDRIRHRADAQSDGSQTYCEASELAWNGSAPTFRGALVDPSGW